MEVTVQQIITPPSSATSIALRTKHAKRVLMNIKDMMASKVSAGDPILIASSDPTSRPCLGVAWPSNTVSPKHVFMPSSMCRNMNVTTNDRVSIGFYNKLIREVDKMALSPLEPATDLGDSELFMIFLKEVMVEMVFVWEQQVVYFSYLGKDVAFRIDSITADSKSTYPTYKLSNMESAPSETSDRFYVVTRDSSISVTNSKPDESVKKNADDVSYESIGGLKEQIKTVRELVELSLKNPEAYQRFGLRPPKGVLLFGPPGTGKTLIARAVANETGAQVFIINGSEIMSKYYGETESRLRAIFAQASEQSPSLIFIDEMDALCPKRDESSGGMEKRIVATLLTLMDGISQSSTSSSKIVVIGATNRPNAIDPALRRPGRFDKELEIGIPDASARLEILRILLSPIPHSLTPSQIQDIASSTHGYVGADLSALCREACLIALKSTTSLLSPSPSSSPSSSSPSPSPNDLETSTVSYSHFSLAKSTIRASAMREITLSIPSTSWSDIGGNASLKLTLQESITHPLLYPSSFRSLGISPPRGVLMYGPPGCSKTLLAKAIATECGVNFVAVKGAEVFNKWVGESEKAIAEVFRKARAAAPAIVFIDEVDAIGGKRAGLGTGGGGGGGDGGGGGGVSDRVLTTLLMEMDGMEVLNNVTVVAATNRPDVLDPALMRPGRFDRLLYVPPPDKSARKAIFEIQFRKIPKADDVDVDKMAEQTEGLSGAEVVSICQDAALLAMREDKNAQVVARRHFEKALAECVPRITKEMLDFYESFGKQRGLRKLN